MTLISSKSSDYNCLKATDHISLIVTTHVNKDEIPALDMLHFMHIAIF